MAIDDGKIIWNAIWIRLKLWIGGLLAFVVANPWVLLIVLAIALALFIFWPFGESENEKKANDAGVNAISYQSEANVAASEVNQAQQNTKSAEKDSQNATKHTHEAVKEKEKAEKKPLKDQDAANVNAQYCARFPEDCQE